MLHAASVEDDGFENKQLSNRDEAKLADNDNNHDTEIMAVDDQQLPNSSVNAQNEVASAKSP